MSHRPREVMRPSGDCSLGQQQNPQEFLLLRGFLL